MKDRKHQLCFNNGEKITDPAILATCTKEGNKHKKSYVMINNTKTQVFTYRAIQGRRLFCNGIQIIDPTILETHTIEHRKHYVSINGQKTNVVTDTILTHRRNNLVRHMQLQAAPQDIPVSLPLSVSERLNPSTTTVLSNANDLTHAPTLGLSARASHFPASSSAPDPQSVPYYRQNVPIFTSFLIKDLIQSPSNNDSNPPLPQRDFVKLKH